jgi:hypothetical protein
MELSFLSELLFRDAQDVPRFGVLNKYDKPQSVSRSRLNRKHDFLRGSAVKIDWSYLLEDPSDCDMRQRATAIFPARHVGLLAVIGKCDI